MKQFFTLLLVILVSIPVNGQAINQNDQESENLMTTKFFSPSNENYKKAKDIQTRDLKVRRKTERLTAKSLEKKYLDSLTNQTWDEDNNLWKYSSKEVFTYNNDKVEMTILYIWDYNSSNWKPFQKDEYTFDSNGNLISEIRSYQFTPSVWTMGEKTEYSYILNSNNLYSLSLEENFSWSTISSQWINTYKYEVTYDSFGILVTLETGYEWNIGLNQWEYMNKIQYINPPLVSEIITSYWNYGTSEWEYNSRSEFSYGDFHPIVPDYEIQYRWETNSTDYWIEENKTEFEYDFGGPAALPRLLGQIQYSWDNGINQWKNDYKDEYEYYAGNRVGGTYFEWNETIADWSPFYKDEFIFDLNFDFDDTIGPFFYDNDLESDVWWFQNMVIGYRSYEYEDPAWKDVNKMLFYYSNYTNPLQVVDKEMVDAVKVYPNPVNDILIVDSQLPLTKVEIYSIFGKKIKEIDNRFEAIPFYNMADGIYIVKIRSEIGVIFKKIIKSNTIL